MSGGPLEQPLLVVVGSGGVGKTTLAAAIGLTSARSGADTLVMTFDPSLRLKDALGVGDEARDAAVRVAVDTSGRLDVALLDARKTFDRLVRRYAPDAAAAERIFRNRFYADLAGNLAGILEYMAVERLFEVAVEGRYDRVILDTPPTRQALDFLEAPERIVGFLDSGALKLALKPWSARRGLRGMPLRLVGKGIEGMLDRVIGLKLLQDMAEFFQAFAPLFDGFRLRAAEVRALLRAPGTVFLLVSGPGEERIPDTLFFARRLKEAGHRLGPIIVNQTHPPTPGDSSRVEPALAGGLDLFRFLGERDRHGLERLGALLSPGERLVELPLLAEPPTDLPALEAAGRLLADRLAARVR